MSKLRPVHPGEILREEFMKPLRLNPHKLTMKLHVAAPRIYQVIREQRDITRRCGWPVSLVLHRSFG